MFIPVADAAEFQLIYSQQDGSFAENTFWVQRDEAWDTASLLTVAAAFKTWWLNGDGTNKLSTHVTHEVSLQQVDGRDNTTDSSPGVVYTTGLPAAGTLDPPTAALGLTMAITSHTGLSGRSYRGRSYLVGLGEANWESFELNTFKADAAGVIQTAFNALPAHITAADAHSQLVVCSRFSGVDPTTHRPIPRVSGVTTPIINYSFHDLLTDFQRRRAPAHNRHH